MSRAEVRWVTWAALAVMLITCIPYLYVASHTPPGKSFSGLLCGADDHCVYLSWEQQAAQGQFFMRNLFTGDTQRGIYVSLLSWAVGTVARFTGLPLILIHHAARVLFGALLLALAYRLFALFTADVTVRRAAFGFTAFSGGLGWLFPAPADASWQGTVDTWMPESITFLSLYVIGLFCVALCLMLGILLCLLTAEGKQGRARWGRVAAAGAMGLLLGNIHSYDVITLAAIWMAYVTVRALTERRWPGRSLVDAAVAGLLASPSVAYQYYLYHVEPVFRLRADDPTLSPSLIHFLLGYGLVLLLALAGALTLVRAARHAAEPLRHRWLPLTWAIVGFAIPYLPFAFQRKLVMGLHLPLAFLAAAGAVSLARFLATTATRRSRSPQTATRVSLGETVPPSRAAWAVQPALVTGLLLMTLPTNWQFVTQDIRLAVRENATRCYLPAYLPDADLAAMRWARQHLPKDAVILCSPRSGHLFPAIAGRAVYMGHVSETPNVIERAKEVYQFFQTTRATPEQRRAFLEQRRVRYVYQGTDERSFSAVDLAHEPSLLPIYSQDGVALYELRPRTAMAVRHP